jgi:hypothetical protein
MDRTKELLLHAILGEMVRSVHSEAGTSSPPNQDLLRLIEAAECVLCDLPVSSIGRTEPPNDDAKNATPANDSFSIVQDVIADAFSTWSITYSVERRDGVAWVAVGNQAFGLGDSEDWDMHAEDPEMLRSKLMDWLVNECT